MEGRIRKADKAGKELDDILRAESNNKSNNNSTVVKNQKVSKEKKLTKNEKTESEKKLEDIDNDRVSENKD